jgi:hypothetical protein
MAWHPSYLTVITFFSGSDDIETFYELLDEFLEQKNKD